MDPSEDVLDLTDAMTSLMETIGDEEGDELRFKAAKLCPDGKVILIRITHQGKPYILALQHAPPGPNEASPYN